MKEENYYTYKNLTCCFTGHRVIPKAQFENVEKRLDHMIDEMYNDGYRIFLSGGAIGFDTLAALCVIRKRLVYNDIKLHLILPCGDQDEKWDFKNKAVYNRIKAAADDVYVMSEKYIDGCMFLRNDELIKRSSACIAFYNGVKGGGTRYTFSRCMENGYKVLNTYLESDSKGKR